MWSMMDLKAKKLIFCALVLIFCSGTGRFTSTGAAHPYEGIKPFPIDGVGTTLLPEGIDFAGAVGTEEMKNMETQYDLTGSGPDRAHYARVIVYKDTHDLGAALALVDLVDFKPELVTLMSNMGQNLVSKKLEENGAKLIEWLPASKVLIQKHNGVQFGARFTLSERLPLPMFTAVAVYTQSGKITGIGLMCPDSDRLYWQPVFNKIISNIVMN